MREIKFRYYEKSTGKLIYPRGANEDWYGEVYLHENGAMQDIRLGSCVNRHRQGLGVLEQFTGLYDNKRTEEFPNGQPIYEGDIVQWEDSTNEEYYGGGVIYPKEPIEFKGGAFYPICMMPEIEFEVIGNVHENKELS